MKRRAPRFEIIVSAENNAYLEWQAMLFHYSCVTVQRQVPLIVVHKGDEPLRPGFQQILARNGRVQVAPNYREVASTVYPPRNTPATLLCAMCDADYVVLCDPDMIFLAPLPLEQLALRPRAITVDRVSYLDPDHESYQPTLDIACRQAGVAPRRLRMRPIRGGVPHVIPLPWKERLATDWLHCVDLLCGITPPLAWLASMWALVLSIHRLRLGVVTTDMCLTNHDGGQRLPNDGDPASALLHYCYGDDVFNKRSFRTAATTRRVWWRPRADRSVHGAIHRQLRAAARYYGIRLKSDTRRSRS